MTSQWCFSISDFLLERLTGYKGKGKSKVHPITIHEGPEVEQRFSCTVSLTSALDGVNGQRDAPAVLPPGKTRYPLYRRLGGSQGRSGRVRKISPSPGFDPRTVQPVESRYTNWAIPTHRQTGYMENNIGFRLRTRIPYIVHCLAFGPKDRETGVRFQGRTRYIFFFFTVSIPASNPTRPLNGNEGLVYRGKNRRPWSWTLTYNTCLS